MSNPLIIDVENDEYEACVTIEIPENSIINGSYDYDISITDGIDFQAQSGSIRYSVANKSGIISHEIFVEIPSQLTTNGTLINSWTITPGINEFTIDAKFTSSLTPTSMELKMYDNTKILDDE